MQRWSVLPVCGAAVCAALLFPWLNVVVGSRSFTIDGIDLTVFRWVLLVLGVAMVVVSIGRWFRSDRRSDAGAMALAICGAVTTGVAILVTESIAGLIPRDLLPATLRRVSFEVSAGVGLWMAFGASLAGVVACTRASRVVASQLSRPGRRTLGVMTVAVGALTVAVGRYQPTAHGQVAGESLELAGWATPYYGPGTLLGLWIVVVALAATIVRPSLVAPLLVASVAWLLSLLSALVVVTSGALARVRLADRLPASVPGSIRDRAFDAHAGSGAWLVYGGAVVLALGAALLFWAQGVEEDPDRA